MCKIRLTENQIIEIREESDHSISTEELLRRRRILIRSSRQKGTAQRRRDGHHGCEALQGRTHRCKSKASRSEVRLKGHREHRRGDPAVIDKRLPPKPSVSWLANALLTLTGVPWSYACCASHRRNCQSPQITSFLHSAVQKYDSSTPPIACALAGIPVPRELCTRPGPPPCPSESAESSVSTRGHRGALSTDGADDLRARTRRS